MFVVLSVLLLNTSVWAIDLPILEIYDHLCYFLCARVGLELLSANVTCVASFASKTICRFLFYTVNNYV